jgi:hypothetical protein
MGKGIALEMDAAPLPSGRQDTGSGRLDGDYREFCALTW